jgi:hypothetical protein
MPVRRRSRASVGACGVLIGAVVMAGCQSGEWFEYFARRPCVECLGECRLEGRSGRVGFEPGTLPVRRAIPDNDLAVHSLGWT